MAAVDGACRLEQGKEDGFLVTVPKNSTKIDLPQLTDALQVALAAGTLEPVACAYEVVEAKPVDFDAFAETYATAKNASYNAAADQVEEGTVQVTFDADAAQKLVAQAQPGQEITVPAQIQQPKVSKAALEKVLFGTCWPAAPPTSAAHGAASRTSARRPRTSPARCLTAATSSAITTP